MLGRIEPPGLLAQPEQRDDLLRDRFLALDRERAVEERVVDLLVAERRDQRHELGLELVEDVAHLGGRRLGLEVVEEDVVALLDVTEAVDVRQPQLDVPLERREEERVVRLRLRLHPHRTRLGRGTGHLRPEIGRNPNRLFVVPAREADQGSVVRVGVERLLQRPQLLEQPPCLVRAQQLVREPPEGRHVIRTVRRAGRGHHRLLVPGEQPRDPVEVGYPGQPLLQLLEGVRHPRQISLASAPPFPGQHSRSGRARAAQTLIRPDDCGLLGRRAAVGDVRRPVQDASLIRPDQAGAAAAVDCDRDRVGEIAVAVVE